MKFWNHLIDFSADAMINVTWNGLRSIQLEDIDLPTGKVLTGLSFDVTTLGNVSRLRLMAHGSEFNFGSGKVRYHGGSQKFSGKNLKFHENDEFPVHEKLLPKKDSNDFVVTDKRISFDISDLETDLGQNTIPFIDIQDVYTKTPTAMGGAGLYYKVPDEKSQNAGYLGLKLKTYDFVPHIRLNKNIVPNLEEYN